MPRLKSPKQKGDRYELELAAYFNQALFDGREVVTRAPLSGGGRSWGALRGGGSDLLGVPGLHVEAKRTERFSPHEAMAQARRSIASNPHTSDTPVVITRRNRTPTGKSLAVLELDDFLAILRLAYKAMGNPSLTREIKDLGHVEEPSSPQVGPPSS